MEDETNLDSLSLEEALSLSERAEKGGVRGEMGVGEGRVSLYISVF